MSIGYCSPFHLQEFQKCRLPPQILAACQLLDQDLNISEIRQPRVAVVCFLWGLAVFGILLLLLGLRRGTVKANSFHYNNKPQMPYLKHPDIYFKAREAAGTVEPNSTKSWSLGDSLYPWAQFSYR